MLDPQRLATVHDTVVLAAVTRGEHVGRRRAQGGIGLHTAALAQRETGPLRQHDVGHDAGAHHHRLGGDARARRGDDRGHATAGALEALDVLAGVDLDAVLLEHVLGEAPGTRTEPALERHLLLHDERAARRNAVSVAATSVAM